MEEVRPLSYPINDFNNWQHRKELVLQPKFQRRRVWSENARSCLIDTILRRLPIPKLYMREQIDIVGRRTLREIVDGQQRLAAVIDYLEGKFPISRSHSEEFGGLYFHQLPKDVQERFLRYRFSVDLLEGATDTDVLEVFSRINSYTIVLNAQEKRNALYIGPFKRTVYELGFEHYRFWLDNKIMSNQSIARMIEAELVSELVIAMIDGFQTGKKTINRFYDEYENDFPQQTKVKQHFRATIDQCAELFDGNLSNTNFRRRPLFYSLFCFIYDAKFGLPRGKGQKIDFASRNLERIRTALFQLDEEISQNWKEPDEPYTNFVRASQRSTSDLWARELRHQFIWDAILRVIE